MVTFVFDRSRYRLAVLSFIAALALAASPSARSEGHTDQGPTTFTSAIDITRGRIHL